MTVRRLSGGQAETTSLGFEKQTNRTNKLNSVVASTIGTKATARERG